MAGSRTRSSGKRGKNSTVKNEDLSRQLSTTSLKFKGRLRSQQQNAKQDKAPEPEPTQNQVAEVGSGQIKKWKPQDFNPKTKTKIGFGGFASIYKAKSKVFSRKELVLKELADSSYTTDNIEFALHTKMKHVNVVAAHGSFVSKKAVLVLDHCKMGDLHDYLMDKGFKQTLVRSKMYIQMVAQGLNYIHSKWRHIHMDLKCENILVTVRDVAKICDFGCAVPMEAGLRHLQTTHNGYTKLNIPVEFIKDRKFDSTADVWALGIIAFELVFGSHPFYPDCSCQFHNASKTCEHDAIALKLMEEARIDDVSGKSSNFGSFDQGVTKEYNNSPYEMKSFFSVIFGVDRLKRPTSRDVPNLSWIKWK